jgi:hypothetical protein
MSKTNNEEELTCNYCDSVLAMKNKDWYCLDCDVPVEVDVTLDEDNIRQTNNELGEWFIHRMWSNNEKLLTIIWARTTNNVNKWHYKNTTLEVKPPSKDAEYYER